ncbi:hypothetical protein ACFXI8_01000 [Streptomyces niveus]|uniref:hypothetical protein n=2 Tax=Actinomycetes TaxID=1760 RepID=UPI0035DA942F
MRTWTRAVPAALGALALALALAGCNDTDSGKSGKGSGYGSGSDSGSSDDKADDKTTYRLGEASPPQESTMQATKDSTFTVTPTKVLTGTEADMAESGLDLAELPGPKVPVYVWSTLTHKSGKPMPVGDMDDDLVVRTDQDDRTKALLVLMGDATWPDCPAPDTEKELSEGQSAEICTTFLITRGEKAAAVELTQGFYNDPLEWPVKG